MKSVERLLELRRHKTLRFEDLTRLRIPTRKAAPFIITADHRPRAEAESTALRPQLAVKPVQADLFA